MNNTDKLTEMLSLVGETETPTLVSTESCWISQEAESCEELEKISRHMSVNMHFLLGTQLYRVAQGTSLVLCRHSEAVILLPGFCSLQVRDKGQETGVNRL